MAARDAEDEGVERFKPIHELIDPILADPEGRAAVEQYRLEAVAESVQKKRRRPGKKNRRRHPMGDRQPKDSPPGAS